jgi:hypothetical protein
VPAKRTCSRPGCPTLINRGDTYCPAHKAQHERARGTRQQRGYTPEHDRARKAWAAKITQQGGIPCARCGQPINPGDPWDLDHTDDRTAYLGPSHPACNAAAGGRAGGGGVG